ncbi:MAG TPA: N-acetyltransferase [Acidimicrobiales bacterium]|nr:N-acetyltransferase [Acidimicrobiales bacterium]
MADPGQGLSVWKIRSARPSDADNVLDLVRAAFTGPDHDGSEEVTIVRETWRRQARIDGLELVADEAGSLVGHVLGARGDIQGRHVLAVAPLCVAPDRQGIGVGTALMTELLERAERQQWPMAVLLGDHRYYSRFGFDAAGRFGIFYGPVGRDDPHFQVRRLGAFDGSIQGEVRYCWELPE